MKRAWKQVPEFGQLGIIESVTLRNFMCHENLTFQFDPHINFIIGRNGSGKSAILTGIILALGGKSGVTGRYSNIKGFIKTGKNSSTVSVTLKNCGPDAYKPEEYGKRITVERSFSQDGTSCYKLKSEAGRLICSSKEELLSILRVMDIQIDNPITVLTQETSRNFLLSKKPDKLFQLFYKGTGLAKVHEDYNKAAQLKSDAKLELKNKKAVLPDMEKEVKKLKSLLDKSSKVTELKKELLWAVVTEFEKKRDESQEAFDKIKKDVIEIEKKIHGYEAELASMGQIVSAAKVEKKESNEKMDAIRKELAELDKKRCTHAATVREIQGKNSSHEREVERISFEIRNLEEIIDDIRKKNESELNADKIRHEMNLNNLKNQIQNVSKHLETLQTQKNDLREAYASITKKIDTCQAELGEITYDKRRIMQAKEQLIEGKNNQINVYGKEMIHVLKDIENAVRARKFRVQPKGPIGMYITVKQSEWIFAVEECLKKPFLRSFVCDNHADCEVLTAILNKHYQRNRPSIITSKFVSEVYDVSQYKTVCDHPTVLDMLTIEDPVITNCLIDQIMIENILLIADPSQALDLMLYRPPAKVKYAYTPNGDQYCHSPFRNYSCRTKHVNNVYMLRKVNEDDIRQKDEELRQLDQNYADKVCDRNSLMQQKTANEQEINNKDTDIAKYKMRLNQLHVKLREEENNYTEPKDINCLHSELVALQKQKEHHEDRYSASKQELDSMTAEFNAIISNADELRSNLTEESQNFQRLSEKLNEIGNRNEKLEFFTEKLKRKLKDMQPSLTECQTELNNDIGTVEIATKSALDVGPRIDTRRSSETIRQILKETELFIQKQKSCDREALLNEYQEKMQNLSKAKQELDRQEKINDRLDRMMMLRMKEFNRICKNTSISLTCCFTDYLKYNNFSGYPEINFVKMTMDIIVKTEKMASKVGTKQQNLSQLSGGERSYVTIALLLSLWDRIHMPFRILDEYDVFMDSSNRHLSISQLINAAKSNTRVQFVFLSPLELPQMENSDDVKIHKMPDPRK